MANMNNMMNVVTAAANLSNGTAISIIENLENASYTKSPRGKSLLREYFEMLLNDNETPVLWAEVARVFLSKHGRGQKGQGQQTAQQQQEDSPQQTKGQTQGQNFQDMEAVLLPDGGMMIGTRKFTKNQVKFFLEMAKKYLEAAKGQQ